jgi:hypothetical protein
MLGIRSDQQDRISRPHAEALLTPEKARSNDRRKYNDHAVFFIGRLRVLVSCADLIRYLFNMHVIN